MYESITYAELKKLPAVEKPEAWKELKSLYKTQKELADKLGVSPAVVYNMISRYAGGEKKAAKLELVPEQNKTGSRVKKQVDKMEQNIAAEKNESFLIAIRKTVSGEDAQFFLGGIGSTLLKNQKYVIEVKIIEK